MFSMFNVVGRVGAMKQLGLLALPKRNLVLCIGREKTGFHFPGDRSLVRSSLMKVQIHLEGES